jgi:hypothetical protein
MMQDYELEPHAPVSLNMYFPLIQMCNGNWKETVESLGSKFEYLIETTAITCLHRSPQLDIYAFCIVNTIYANRPFAKLAVRGYAQAAISQVY